MLATKRVSHCGVPINWFRDDLRPRAFQVWKENEEKVGFTTIYFFSSEVSVQNLHFKNQQPDFPVLFIFMWLQGKEGPHLTLLKMRPYHACVQIKRGVREKEQKCSYSVSAFILLFSEYFYLLAAVISSLLLCNIEKVF